jgi:hypothetical protein
VAGCRAAVQAAVAEAERLLEHLRDALGERVRTERPSDVLGDLMAEARPRVARARAAVDALGALGAALTEARRAGEAAQGAAVEAAWPDVQHAVAAARPRGWREDARREVAEHERELHAAVVGVRSLRDQLSRPVRC